MKFPKINIRISHISSFQCYQLFRYGALILIGILFSKSHLSLQEIGQYETLLLVSGAVTFFWVAGLMNSMVTLYPEEGKPSSFFFNSFLLVSIFNVLIILLMVFFKTQIIATITHGKDIPYFNLLLLYMFLNTPSFLIEHILLIKKDGKQILLYGSSIYPLQVILVAAPVFLGYGIEASVWGLIIIAILKLIILTSLLLQHTVFRVDYKMIQDHLKLAYPLMIAALFSGSADYIDGIIVSKKCSPEHFAIFRFGARELPFTLLMANALGVALLPVFRNKFVQESFVSMKTRSRRLMHLLFPVTFILLVTSHKLYPFIFNANFAASASVFNVFLLLIVSRLVFPQTILIGTHKTRVIMVVSFIEIVINVTSSLVLLHYFGIIGVAYGTVIAYYSEKILLIAYVNYFFQLKTSDYIPIRLLSVYTILLIVCFLLVEVVFL